MRQQGRQSKRTDVDPLADEFHVVYLAHRLGGMVLPQENEPHRQRLNGTSPSIYLEVDDARRLDRHPHGLRFRLQVTQLHVESLRVLWVRHPTPQLSLC